MHNRLDIVFFENGAHTVVVSNITLFKWQAFAENFLKLIQNSCVAIAEVVINDDFVAAFSHFYRGVRADKTGTAR